MPAELAAQDKALVGQNKIEHLKMIQDVIRRLAGESANVKTWSAGLVTGLLVASRLAQDRWLVLLAVVPVLTLASLDAYYLGLERRYRDLFEGAARGEIPGWNMGIGEARYVSTARAGCRASVRIFYGGLTFAVLVGVSFWSSRK